MCRLILISVALASLSLLLPHSEAIRFGIPICTTKFNCTFQCPDNAYYTDRGPNCDTICAELNEPCNVRYIQPPSGCYCQKGYARDYNGTCIPIEKCPSKCPPNELYVKCNSFKMLCESKCSSLNARCNILWKKPCLSGCVCQNGYARDDNGECIPIEKCPIKDNEYYTDCGPDCDTECATLNEPCLINHFVCPSGFYCKKGYARDIKGVCIPIEKCPAKI